MKVSVFVFLFCLHGVRKDFIFCESLYLKIVTTFRAKQFCDKLICIRNVVSIALQFI